MAQVTITYLEMRSASELRPKRHPDARFWIKEATTQQWRFNRFMYEAVGSYWEWFDKKYWTEAQWREYTEAVRTFGAYYDGSPAGYYELKRDGEGGVEIVYMGLLPGFIGRGFGAALLTSALEEAWAMTPARVWLHTCTLDHPAAIGNYLARGMKVYHIVE